MRILYSGEDFLNGYAAAARKTKTMNFTCIL
jgi:hypothetical protein